MMKMVMRVGCRLQSVYSGSRSSIRTRSTERGSVRSTTRQQPASSTVLSHHSALPSTSTSTITPAGFMLTPIICCLKIPTTWSTWRSIVSAEIVPTRQHLQRLLLLRQVRFTHLQDVAKIATGDFRPFLENVLNFLSIAEHWVAVLI